jgi:hypothetical protein
MESITGELTSLQALRCLALVGGLIVTLAASATSGTSTPEDWVKVGCKAFPIRVSHHEFSPDAFECLKAREDFAPNIHEKAILQLTDTRFIYANWSLALGDRLFKTYSGPQLRGALSVTSRWAREDMSFAWTDLADINEGKYLQYFVDVSSGAKRTCFGYVSLGEQMNGGYRLRRSVIYCELGHNRFSESDVQTILDSIEFENLDETLRKDAIKLLIASIGRRGTAEYCYKQVSKNDALLKAVEEWDKRNSIIMEKVNHIIESEGGMPEEKEYGDKYYDIAVKYTVDMQVKAGSAAGYCQASLDLLNSGDFDLLKNDTKASAERVLILSDG